MREENNYESEAEREPSVTTTPVMYKKVTNRSK